MRISIFSPIFGVSTGGAASYYNLFCSFLDAESTVSEIYVFSENETENKDYCSHKFTKVRFVNSFPKRASSVKVGIRYIFLLFLQNLNFVKLLCSKKLKNSDVIVVHSSFLNLPNLLIFPILLHRKKVVLDVRDTQLPWWLKFQLGVIENVIGCSEGIGDHLNVDHQNFNYLKARVPLNLSALRRLGRGPKLSASGSHGVFHIAVVGLVKAGKGVQRILEAFECLPKDQFCLHVVGVVKEQVLVTRHRTAGNIHFHGGLPHEDTISLIAKSDLLVSGSKSEGMPRSLLEAICVGTPILPPECVSEFRDFGDSHRILNHDSPSCIARKIEDAVTRGLAQNYDISAHSHNVVFANYLAFFKSSINKLNLTGDRNE
jgi:glycosyltransferase involved in cell wall biosynthesis